MQPLVSILITVFNREAYLSQAIASALDSNFQDFEILIVDDASSDGSRAVAAEFERKDNRVLVHSNAQNLGQFANRQKAASLARGKYLKYLDSDDVLYSHSLDLMVDALERHSDAGLALSHSAPEAEAPYPLFLSTRCAYERQFLGRGCLSCGPSGAIIRREAFEEVGGYVSKWGVVADVDLWYRLAACWPVVLLPPGLVWWRRHGGQEFSATDSDLSYLRDGFEVTQAALSSKHCPLNEAARSKALERCRQHHARRLLALALHQHRPVTAARLYRESGLSFTELLQGFRSYR